jgi:hypothetical protein
MPGSWLASARYRTQRMGNIPLLNESSVPRILRLRNAGYLERLKLNVSHLGVYVTAGPTGVDAFGSLCGPVERIIVQANSIGRLFDVSGIGAKFITWLDSQYRFGAAPSSQVVPTGVTASVGFPYTGPPDSFTAAPALAAFNNLWTYDIPISLQLVNKPWPYGLFQLAINAQEVDLDVRFRTHSSNTTGAPGNSVYTGNTANYTFSSGGVDVEQTYFDPIPDPTAQPSLAYVHQWTEFQQSVNADGDTEIRLPPNNFYLRVLAIYVEGSAGALAPNGWVSPASPGKITRFRIMYGPNLAPIDLTASELVQRMTQNYGLGLLPGYYALDLLEDTHTERDMLNAAATTDLRVVITTAGGVYSGGAYVKIITEQLVPIQVGTPGQAMAQGVAA